jgi:radical SAM superfamily enzyme YgiQ (UPF0313 family)
MKIVLISTYELGRQPFGLASPAAWLGQRGHEVACIDLSRQPFDDSLIRSAGLVAFYVPMHTAARLAIPLLEPVRRMNPDAHICFYGLYAPMNEAHLRAMGAETILGGEFEEGLVHLAGRLAENGTPGPRRTKVQEEPVTHLARQKFILPERRGLPPLQEYAHLNLPTGEHRIAGYTEASRGCKHLCRHCPIVPVYKGVFRIVDREVVLADIRQQAAAGAQHITFGDPDFFNGPGHAMAIVKELHREFPRLTYDVTIKIEHLLKHEEQLAALRDTGCLFVTSAVESLDDEVLERLDKGHTRADFLEVVRTFRRLELTLQPTFVPFTPWTNLETYLELLQVLQEEGLIAHVAPIQLAIRLLIPAGSRLLELGEVQRIAAPYDPQALVHPWKHSDRRVDALCEEVQQIAATCEKLKRPRHAAFECIFRAAQKAAVREEEAAAPPGFPVRAAIPHLSEPWYC